MKSPNASTSNPSRLKQSVLLCLALLVFLVLCSTVLAQQDPGPSPKTTQEAFKQGVLAAQKQEWFLALRYFEEARRGALLAPEILFNLGLTESEIPGRELRSMAWFKAYLAVMSDGPNTKAIKETCDTLETAVKRAAGKMLGQTRQLAGRLPNAPDRNTTLNRVAVAQAALGDFPGAIETVYQIDGDRLQSGAYLKIAVLQAEAGDVDGARKTLAECKNNLCDQQQALILIARAQVKANKTPEAIKTLVEARDFVGRYGKDKESAYTDIASFQAQLGDIEGAQKTAALMVDPRSIGQKKVILAPRQPVEKNESPENKKHPAQFFTNLIDTKLNQVVFLNPEVYFQSLAKTLGPRERVEELLRAAEETTENLKALKQPPGQP